MIIRGAASGPVRLEITDGKARIVDAAELTRADKVLGPDGSIADERVERLGG